MVENLIKKFHQKDLCETCKLRAMVYILQEHNKMLLRTGRHPHNWDGVVEGNEQGAVPKMNIPPHLCGPTQL